MDYLNKLRSGSQNITGKAGPIFNKSLDYLNSESTIAKLLKVLVMIIILVVVIETGVGFYKQYKKWKSASPWILKATKNAKKRMVILQDPKKDGAITLNRSENERAGLEFSYTFWMYINDWGYKHGAWKHVFHKGNESSWPLRGPGVWLHPKNNAMRVYMNTFKNIAEYTDIENIPLNKWFHVTVAVRQRNLDIYINGNLAKRHTLEGIPKQNYGDVYLNSFRGFGGYMSNIRYFDYYLSFSELDGALQAGPSNMPCVDSTEYPPYFSANWWSNQ